MAVVEREIIELRVQNNAVGTDPQESSPKRWSRIREVAKKTSGAAAIAGMISFLPAATYTGIQAVRLGGQEAGLNAPERNGTPAFSNAINNTETKIGWGVRASAGSGVAYLLGGVVYLAITEDKTKPQA